VVWIDLGLGAALDTGSLWEAFKRQGVGRHGVRNKLDVLARSTRQDQQHQTGVVYLRVEFPSLKIAIVDGIT